MQPDKLARRRDCPSTLRPAVYRPDKLWVRGAPLTLAPFVHHRVDGHPAGGSAEIHSFLQNERPTFSCKTTLHPW